MIELVGHKIIRVDIAEGENAIRFSTNAESLIYQTYGDCCSETWFSEILGLDSLINHTVSGVEALTMPVYDDGNGRQEYDQFYGYRIDTEVGSCTIAFRNSSNGYYGGSCELETITRNGNNVWYDVSHLTDWTAYENNGRSYMSYLKLKAFW
jgi:hypothetical protein